MAILKAWITNLVICIIWYAVEYLQFGELQLNRKCDVVVFALYLNVLCYLFAKSEMRNK